MTYLDTRDWALEENRAPSVGLVIPAKNEAKNISYVLKRVPDCVDEVILVDGDSTDNTIEVARKLWPEIKVVGQDRKGKGAALRAGFAACTKDIVVMIDADGSMDPGEIQSFVDELVKGADFVKGSRFLDQGGTDDMEWYRFLGNWSFVQIVNWRFGGSYSDLCYGYNAFWRTSLNHLSLENDDGFEIETSMNVQALMAGLNVSEVPSIESERIHGVSNLRTIPDGWRVLSTIVRLSMSQARSQRRKLA